MFKKLSFMSFVIRHLCRIDKHGYIIKHPFHYS